MIHDHLCLCCSESDSAYLGAHCWTHSKPVGELIPNSNGANHYKKPAEDASAGQESGTGEDSGAGQDSGFFDLSNMDLSNFGPLNG